MVERSRDPVASVMGGAVPLDGALGAWLAGRLAESYPEVHAAATARTPSFAEWESVPWWFVEADMERAEPDARVRADWRCACDLAEALGHPLERLDEAVQPVRRAVMGLFDYAGRSGDPALAEGARGIARSLALAFACIDVMDEGYDLGAETRSWRARLAGTDVQGPRPGGA